MGARVAPSLTERLRGGAKRGAVASVQLTDREGGACMPPGGEVGYLVRVRVRGRVRVRARVRVRVRVRVRRRGGVRGGAGVVGRGDAALRRATLRRAWGLLHMGRGRVRVGAGVGVRVRVRVRVRG